MVNLILEARRIKHSNGVHCLLTAAARCRERRDPPSLLSVFPHSSPSSSSFATMNWDIVGTLSNFLTCLPLFPNYFVLPFFFSANIDVNLTFLLFPFVTLFIYLFIYQSRFIVSFFSFIFSLIVGFFFMISFRHSLWMLGPQSSFPPPSRPTTQLSPPSATSSPVTVPPFFPLPRCESIYQLKSVSVAALNGPPTDDE